MGKLSRRRRARDVWISQSHLAAAACLAVLLCGFSFGAGYLMGREGAPVVRAPSAPTGRADGLPDDALLELLARLETTSAVDGGVQDLTFPDVLRGAPGRGIQPEVAPPTAPLRLPPRPTDLAGDPLPSGRFTIAVGRYDEAKAGELHATLRDRGIESFRAPQVVDGAVSVRIGIGGFESEAAASARLRTLEATLGALGLYPQIQALPR